MPLRPSSHRHESAYVLSVNMGYGHERAAYALKDLAKGGVITTNAYPGIPAKEKKVWDNSRRFYEGVSRLKPIPLIGDAAFGVMDYLQRIDPFYPRRDLSAPTSQIYQTYYSIEHLGLCRHLIDTLAKKPLPLISTFFLPAFAAEEFDYPEDIYLVICDADMARAWVPRDPKKSRIKYFAPNGRVVERLKLYGVRESQIFLTGFPLPPELIGGPEGTVIKKDLMARLCNLDPKGIFLNKYARTLEAELGAEVCKVKPHRPPTVTFSVGGAGAQKGLALTLLKSLKSKIKRSEMVFRLVAGTKKDIAQEFTEQAGKLGLRGSLGKSLHVDAFPDRATYFKEFSKILKKTDIIWTKPSELSFYCGLGFPIIMAPPIGSQEQFNQLWLQSVGAGMMQNDPEFVNEWLFDWLESGGLARMAWNGYIEAPTHGTYRIDSVITKENFELAKLPLIV